MRRPGRPGSKAGGCTEHSREAGRRASRRRGDSGPGKAESLEVPVDTPCDTSPSTGGPGGLGGPEDRSLRIKDSTGLLGAQGR